MADAMDVDLNPEDARNFSLGMLVWKLGADGPRRETWRDRLRGRLRRLLWWRQDRYETTAIDVAGGRITLERLSWSWSRWRWER